MNSLLGNWASTLRRNLLLLVLSILLPTFGMCNSVMAAERIYASYSVLELSLPVSSLENYAKTGVISDDLAIYQQYLPSPQLQELRQILLQPVKVSPVVAAQFLYTSQGEFLLRRLAALVKTKSHQPKSEFYALRSALILASGEPGGLTLLNLLRKYPHSSIHIDLASSLSIAAELEKLINATKQAIAIVTKQSNLEAASITATNLSPLPDLRFPGRLTSQKYTLKFFDLQRNRRLLQQFAIKPTTGIAF